MSFCKTPHSKMCSWSTYGLAKITKHHFFVLCFQNFFAKKEKQPWHLESFRLWIWSFVSNSSYSLFHFFPSIMAFLWNSLVILGKIKLDCLQRGLEVHQSYACKTLASYKPKLDDSPSHQKAQFNKARTSIS